MKLSPVHQKSAGGVVVNPDGLIAVVENEDGVSWTFPKGGVEEGEDILFAAKREVYEETGIRTLELIRDLGTFDRKPAGHPPTIKSIHLFLFKTKETKIDPVDPENPEARWVEKDKVTDLLTHEEDKDFFRSIQNLIPD